MKISPTLLDLVKKISCFLSNIHFDVQVLCYSDEFTEMFKKLRPRERCSFICNFICIIFKINYNKRKLYNEILYVIKREDNKRSLYMEQIKDKQFNNALMKEIWSHIIYRYFSIFILNWDGGESFLEFFHNIIPIIEMIIGCILENMMSIIKIHQSN